ncbi:hypothetical protein MRX96_018108 [Rhipicephalus microplus]
MPAIQNKNALSNGTPKSVVWSTDDPGQTSKAATTQPAFNNKQGGQDKEPVKILDSRWPFQIQFEIKDAATGQTSKHSGEEIDRAGKLFTATVGFGQRTDQATEKQFPFDLHPIRSVGTTGMRSQ